MFRRLAVFTIFCLCFLGGAIADDGHSAPCQHCNRDVTTLRLYFPPNAMSSGHNPDGFAPEVAKLYVDDLYVGDAIVNVHGHVPTLRFPKSSPKLRITMSNDRVFETKMTFLGYGSTQVLYVDFSKTKRVASTTKGSSDASMARPFDN